MAMLPCPHCGGPGISIARKLGLGPAIPATCRTCGRKIGVSYGRAMLAFLPLGIAGIATEIIDTLPLRILVLGIGAGGMLYMYLKHVPLVPRQQLDAWERVHLLRTVVWLGPLCYTLLSLLWGGLAAKGVIPLWLLTVLLALNVPLTGAAMVLFYHGTGGAAKGLVDMLHSAGDIPPPPSYPRQDVLIARGQYAEAAEYFRDHIRVMPEDVDARLRMAYLLERHLNDAAGAERLYLEVRHLKPDAHQEATAANGLIDLYRRTGRRDRLKVELARFAARYQGTAAGAAAARELRELKAEDAGGKE